MTPLLDVNILILAHRAELPAHAAMKSYLDSLRYGRTSFGIPELVLSAFVRIVTAQKPFVPPTDPHDAFSFVGEITASPRCNLVRPGETHWNAFEALARRVKARGNLVPDAYLAAMAIEQGFEFVTLDEHFAKFPGLTWRRPLDAQPTTNPR